MRISFSSYLAHFIAQELRDLTEEKVVGFFEATLLLEG